MKTNKFRFWVSVSLVTVSLLACSREQAVLEIRENNRKPKNLMYGVSYPDGANGENVDTSIGRELLWECVSTYCFSEL